MHFLTRREKIRGIADVTGIAHAPRLRAPSNWRKPTIVSNWFLGVCARVRQGHGSPSCPHTFPHLFGPDRDILPLDLIEPSHSEAIGLVPPDRDPQSPMASAILASTLDSDLAKSISTTLAA